MSIINKYKDWDHGLLEKYNSIWPDIKYLNWDGVISPEDYFKANVRVMFLNKEAYGDDYNINEELKKQIDKGLVVFRDNPIKNRIKNRLRAFLLLDKDLLEFTNDAFEKYEDSYTEKEFREDLLKVAYCNIKKSDGVGKSSKSDLRKCYLKNREIIKEQISFFNPSIICGGNVFDGIIERDETIGFGEDLYAHQSRYVNIYTIIINGKEYPFVDMYHPSFLEKVGNLNERDDKLELFRALKHVEKNNPSYWKSRCGLTCFE